MVSGSAENSPILFLLWNGLAIAFAVLLFLLFYRIYTLSTTQYSLSSNALDLQWGLRREVIPLDQINWVRPVSDFESKLPLPWFRFPGNIFAKRYINGLGTTQFVVTRLPDTILVQTHRLCYAISPQNSLDFLQKYKRFSEFGPEQQVQPISTSFRTFWNEMWHDEQAKTLVSIGLVLVGVAWLCAVGLMVTFAEVTWVDLQMVPSTRLILLAILASILWLTDLWSGLFFYLHGSVSRLIIYMLWGSSILTSLLLIISMLLLTV